MLDNWSVAVLVGSILGFLSGLGIGGGSLLILWLTMALGMDHGAARGINLLFFLPSAVITCFFRWKQGNLSFPKILPAILAGCAAALLFSWFGMRMDMKLLKKLFGGLLIVTGIREVLYKGKKNIS